MYNWIITKIIRIYINKNIIKLRTFDILDHHEKEDKNESRSRLCISVISPTILTMTLKFSVFRQKFAFF